MAKRRNLMLLSLVATLIFGVMSVGLSSTNAAGNYTYKKVTKTVEKGSVVLHIIETSPSNIKFETLNETKALKDTSYIGINGGFFTSGNTEPSTNKIKTHNIAINNGAPIIPAIKGKEKEVANNGWYNMGKSGTIIWDHKSKKFIYGVVGNGWDVNTLVGHSNYWAQGGISMAIGDKNWRTTANGEGLNKFQPDSKTKRTGMVYSGSKVHLIVSDQGETASDFRAAIEKEYGSSAKGIFLDGGGSSELRAVNDKDKAITVTGTTRKLVQIITVK
ncbi:phosphodiester glycosidase family protein [Paenibacillus alvei]|uniref:phosphodiester glycosidase family protein n=1 Tax=Paenibacillus alvei TaxID=44250 RepID=UPI00227E3DBD|nr:phosphodiester glycosidase family protein [Paenibacillus alvei]